jgi:hypothetical protein
VERRPDGASAETMCRRERRGAFRTWAEQHRQHAEKHIVADDDVGREVLQSILQAIMLG